MTTSWDDGHPLDFRVADLLDAHGLTGTFYIPRANPEQAVMPAHDVKRIAARFEVGAHTLSHLPLITLDEVRAQKEIADSKAWLENLLSRPCPMFCPPRGQFGAAHVQMVRQAGYRGLRTVELLSLAAPRCDAGLWMMPTTLQAYPHRTRAYLRNVLKRRAFNNLLPIPRLARGTWVDHAQAMIERVAKRGGVFHLWGHSWEIQQANLWGQLEEVFAIMRAHLDTVPCRVNSALCGDGQRSMINDQNNFHAPTA